jgi:SAM-dependent methyltransferase
MTIIPDENLTPGARHYTSLLLFAYDFWVLYLSNTFAWRCPTKSVLLPFFRGNAGPRHMDVGVGTGYFPAEVAAGEAETRGKGDSDKTVIKRDWPQKLALVDVNPECLETASARIGRPDRTNHLLIDVLRPVDPGSVPVKVEEVFDSISLMYLLHCLAGPPAEKTQLVLANLKPYLSDRGTLFGATILGKGVRHNWFGRILMRYYNRIGIFNNYADGKDEILDALEKEFDDVEGHVVGCVLVFRARGPRRS